MQGPHPLCGWLRSAHTAPGSPGNNVCSCAEALNKQVSSVGSLKKEENQLVASPPGKDEAAGGSWTNRLQTTLLLFLQPGSPGPEQAFRWDWL